MRKKNKNAPTRAKSTFKRNYFTFLIKRFWIWLKNLIFKMQPIFKKGTHIITGYPGSGKTLSWLVLVLMEITPPSKPRMAGETVLLKV